MTFPYPLITLEEHWLSKDVADFYATHSHPDPYNEIVLRRVRNDLMELGDVRVDSMRQNGIALQVVSHAAQGCALDLETCIKVNNEVAQASKVYKSVLVVFATLPMGDPDAACKELKRCVTELGFVGALVDNNCEGRFYDGASYRPIFETLQELDVPLYIHPTYNSETKGLLYEGNYKDEQAQTLSTHNWGWHSETGLHFLRLYAAGVFDKFPRLKIILGHLGEMLPFMLDRVIRQTSVQWPVVGVQLERQLRQVWDENVWITTSGMFSLPPMATVLRQCKTDRILFSVDYPFVKNEWGVKFLHDLRDDGMVSDEVLEAICYKNAEKLLKIKVPQ